MGAGGMKVLFANRRGMREHQAELERWACQPPNVRFEPGTVSGGQRILLVHLSYERTGLGVYTRSRRFSRVTRSAAVDYERRAPGGCSGRDYGAGERLTCFKGSTRGTALMSGVFLW